MAKLTISTVASDDMLITIAGDDTIAEILTGTVKSFSANGGVLVGPELSGDSHTVRWIPATSDLVAEFDGEPPTSLYDLNTR